MRRIWLCADDYGIAPGVDRAIRDLIERGRLNATSVMVVAPSFARQSAQMLAALNSSGTRAAIGLHVTLTGPLRPKTPDYGPAVEGAFLPLGATLRLAMQQRLDMSALTREIEAQLVAFSAAFGRPPDYVDGHQHVHLFPQVRHAVADDSGPNEGDAAHRRRARLGEMALRTVLADLLADSAGLKGADEEVPNDEII